MTRRFWKNLSRRQKAECAAASLLTVVLLAAMPAYAWFSKNKNLETITKIKEPGEIIIRAGKAIKTDEADDILNFEMKDIDIESISKGNAQRFVFSVMPGDFGYYDLQLAHTTNIPFTYTIYKASETGIEGKTDAQIAELAQYHPLSDSTNIKYYQKGEQVAMSVLNAENDSGSTDYGRTVAKNHDTNDNFNCYSQTYDTGDRPDIYAIPLYLQNVSPLSHSREAADDYDYYVLELGWDETADLTGDYADWNRADNKKETDIIYITAKRRG